MRCSPNLGRMGRGLLDELVWAFARFLWEQRAKLLRNAKNSHFMEQIQRTVADRDSTIEAGIVSDSHMYCFRLSASSQSWQCLTKKYFGVWDHFDISEVPKYYSRVRPLKERKCLGKEMLTRQFLRIGTPNTSGLLHTTHGNNPSET